MDNLHACRPHQPRPELARTSAAKARAFGCSIQEKFVLSGTASLERSCFRVRRHVAAVVWSTTAYPKARVKAGRCPSRQAYWPDSSPQSASRAFGYAVASGAKAARVGLVDGGTRHVRALSGTRAFGYAVGVPASEQPASSGDQRTGEHLARVIAGARDSVRHVVLPSPYRHRARVVALGSKDAIGPDLASIGHARLNRSSTATIRLTAVALDVNGMGHSDRALAWKDCRAARRNGFGRALGAQVDQGASAGVSNPLTFNQFVSTRLT